jgi:hypothetical protein
VLIDVAAASSNTVFVKLSALPPTPLARITL